MSHVSQPLGSLIISKSASPKLASGPNLSVSPVSCLMKATLEALSSLSLFESSLDSLESVTEREEVQAVAGFLFSSTGMTLPGCFVIIGHPFQS